jgi:hypothetical protein
VAEVHAEPADAPVGPEWGEDLASGEKYLMMEASYERVDAAGTT